MAKTRKKAPARSKARRSAPARKSSGKKVAKPRTAKKGAKRAAKKTLTRAVAKKAASKTRSAAKKSVPTKSAAKKSAPHKTAPQVAAPRSAPPRRPPALDRERRTIREDDVIPTPPSSLNMDRTASAVRTGRHEFAERLRQHTSTGPAMTGGDVDADWEDAEAVGDEAPGGDNPTPDQDIVEEIGEAMGVTYEDNEPLKGGDEIVERDRHRWELDPASREDYDEED